MYGSPCQPGDTTIIGVLRHRDAVGALVCESSRQCSSTKINAGSEKLRRLFETDRDLYLDEEQHDGRRDSTHEL